MDFKEVNEFLYEVIAAAENLVRFYIQGSVFSCTKNYVLGSEYLIEKNFHHGKTRKFTETVKERYDELIGLLG